MKDCKLHILKNGIRVLYVASESPVSYLGVAINAGTRDEKDDEWGMAHFVEHMLFKGTEHRKSWHIINRLESVGGQLDAYTTKEDTFVYATVATEHTERALDLISDIVFRSTFSETEMDKEMDVVFDEIQSYNDSPSELIYDDFEQALFPNDTFGRNILGSEQSLETFTSEKLSSFVQRCYTTDQMVLFYHGAMPFNRLLKLAEKTFSVEATTRDFQRHSLSQHVVFDEKRDMDTHQAHSVIGTVFCAENVEERLTYSLLSNILGGPYMSSLLNMAVREKNGLAYQVESGITYYSDFGVWNIYFGCDEKNHKKARGLVMRELEKLATTPMREAKLKMYKAQLKGQLLIASQNSEMQILALAKCHLHDLPLMTDEESLAIIEKFTPDYLQSFAARLLDKTKISYLTFL